MSGGKSKRKGFFLPAQTVYELLVDAFPNKVNPKCAVYLTAILDYLTAEIIELASKKAIERGSDTVTLEDVTWAMHHDPELNKAFPVLGDDGVNYEFSEKVDCIADPLLSVSVVESGLIGCLVNMISLMYLFTGARQRYVEKCRCIFQCVLFVNNVLGLFHVYSIWKPDVLDAVNPDYCHFQLYWISFFCFHCAAVFYTVIFSLLLGALIYYSV
ncbi:uncharacterized protein CDAR_28021 [Caerostris darwini]|uniref:Histone H2A n=1 Tax=Caerostris darwini TaxID=1538125 RepID=A0AAV4QM16_9ARAC|nr:uncharacterized protein CDAR_28021 [Caerostris darwini]